MSRLLGIIAAVCLFGACASQPETLVFDSSADFTDATVELDGTNLSDAERQVLEEGATETIHAATTDAMADAASGSTTILSDATAHFTPLMNAWVDCFNAPEECRIAKITAPDSPERTRLAEATAYYTAERMRTRPGEGRLEWNIESAQAPSNDALRLVTCEYDTRIYFDASLADTELGDIIIDSTVWTRRVEWGLRRVDNAWRIESRRIERRSPVERFCQP